MNTFKRESAGYYIGEMEGREWQVIRGRMEDSGAACWKLWIDGHCWNFPTKRSCVYYAREYIQTSNADRRAMGQ